LIGRLAYSCGALAAALSYQTFSTFIIFFYVDKMKLPVHLAGLAMLVYAAWNAVNDPFFGFLSDNTRTKWGRRRPYLLFGAIPLGLLFFCLWIPPLSGLDQPLGLFFYFLLLICLFDGAYSVCIINWSALFPEMFQGLKDRAAVNVNRQALGMLGLLIGVALPPVIYSNYGWGAMGAVMGVIISLSLLVALAGSRENKRYSADKPLHFFPALKATLQSRSFLSFAFANLFLQYALTLILATLPFFAKYILDADPQTVTGIIAAAFLTAIPALFIWKMVATRFGAKACFMSAILFLAAALWPLFLAQNYVQVLISSVVIGAGIAGFILVADLIIAEVIDEDEVRTGVRREGAFFGCNAFITRFAIGLEAVTMSAVFILSGYMPYVYTQPRSFQLGLRWLAAGFPSLALLLGFVIMLAYPLAGRRLEEMKIKLNELHLQKGVI